MTEELESTEFATHEGDRTIEGDGDTEDTTSTESSTENNENEEGQSSEGQQDANTQDDPDKDKPFHEHPRWKQRETEWETRFNEQERRHQDDMKSLRDEFSGQRKANAEQTQIPSWFGGTQEQWDAYRADRDAEITSAEERAVKRIEQQKETQSKAVKEATDYMKSELATIEKDKTLNPTGTKIDPKKLLQAVLDNDLVDSQGRWNYRAGFRLLQQQGGAGTQGTKPKTGDKKIIAGATTTTENRAETQTPKYKTSADFKKNRPW